MVYTMKIYVDGGCRGNGQPGAVGAAAAVLQPRYGKSKIWTRTLPTLSHYSPPPTNQRAEITAIILGLETALQRFGELHSSPRLNVKIYSDSRYAIGCMTEWIYKWSRNGWVNSAGNSVANRDLIEKASNLDDLLSERGRVTYRWIPREDNVVADRWCNKAMNDA